jgi:hypothetical protein
MNIITAETKYNVGNKVYVIWEYPKYNDYYNNETHWVIMRDESEPSWNPSIAPLEIEEIIIHQYKKSHKVVYLIQNHLFTEGCLYTDLNKAEEECEKLNKK